MSADMAVALTALVIAVLSLAFGIAAHRSGRR